MLFEEYHIMYKAENNYWWYQGLHELIVKLVYENKRNHKLDILDAGCGTCRLMQILSKENNVEGFDFSDIALELCNKRNVKNIIKQDINVWKPTKKYDVIISADVICSDGIIDEKKIVDNFYSGLLEHGILIMNLPAFELLKRNHDKAVLIRKRYTRKEIKDVLIKSGFSEMFITYRLPWLFFIIIFVKLGQKISKNKSSKSDLKKLPDFFNKLLLILNRLDNFFIKKRIFIPIGSSVFVVAKK